MYITCTDFIFNSAAFPAAELHLEPLGTAHFSFNQIQTNPCQVKLFEHLLFCIPHTRPHHIDLLLLLFHYHSSSRQYTTSAFHQMVISEERDRLDPYEFRF